MVLSGNSSLPVFSSFDVQGLPGLSTHRRHRGRLGPGLAMSGWPETTLQDPVKGSVDPRNGRQTNHLNPSSWV